MDRDRDDALFPSMRSHGAREAISVSEATYRIKVRLEDMAAMTVEGDVTNCRPPNASGHLYFTLGDESAKLNVAFFRFRREAQKDFRAFRNGDRVRVTGRISVYAASGSYHLVAERVEPCGGLGDLLIQFEKLRQKLIAEGLTDPARKRPIPVLPRRIGVVTAATGAAVRDILSILGRRFPNLHILVANCRVQGTGAAEEIAAAVRLLNRRFGPGSAEPLDAMIVGRGGGSYEELWCFSEEVVARAVAESAIPVISAVGHEPDIAMTDFVADLRAPTPSAAAELICANRDELVKSVTHARDALMGAMRTVFIAAREKVRGAEAVPLLRDPERILEGLFQRTEGAALRAETCCERALQRCRRSQQELTLAFERLRGSVLPEAARALDRTLARMETAVRRRLEAEKAALPHAEPRMLQALLRRSEAAASAAQSLSARLEALNPYAVLRRGYSLTTDAAGRAVTDAARVAPGDLLTTRLAEGSVTSVVQE